VTHLFDGVWPAQLAAYNLHPVPSTNAKQLAWNAAHKESVIEAAGYPMIKSQSVAAVVNFLQVVSKIQRPSVALVQ